MSGQWLPRKDFETQEEGDASDSRVLAMGIRVQSPRKRLKTLIGWGALKEGRVDRWILTLSIGELHVQ